MNQNSNKNKDTKLVLGILFVFFAVIFAINFIYIYLAQKTWRGIHTKDSYQKGLQYNKALENAETQKNLGWNFNISYKNSNNNAGELFVCLLDKNKSLIKDAKLVAQITRPTQEGYDFKQDLMPKNNCYFAKINFPLKGQWQLEIQAFQGDKVFQEVKRYVVK